MANAKPVAEVRIGAIKAAIWKNEAGNSTRHNVTFQRIYKDGDEWKTTSKLRPRRASAPRQGRRPRALAHLRAASRAERRLTRLQAAGSGPPRSIR